MSDQWTLSPGASRRCMFLALEVFVASTVCGWCLIAADAEPLAAVLVATMSAFVFVSGYAAVTAMRNGFEDPTVSFSIMTRTVIVPIAVIAHAYHQPMSESWRIALFMGSILGIAMWAIHEAVRCQEGRAVADTVQSGLTVQMGSMLLVFIAASAVVSFAVSAGAVIVIFALGSRERARLKAQTENPTGSSPPP